MPDHMEEGLEDKILERAMFWWSSQVTMDNFLTAVHWDSLEQLDACIKWQ